MADSRNPTDIKGEKKYYDPEYDRIVDESVPKSQYEWFSQQTWFHKTYEQFLSDNFLNEEDIIEKPNC